MLYAAIGLVCLAGLFLVVVCLVAFVSWLFKPAAKSPAAAPLLPADLSNYFAARRPEPPPAPAPAAAPQPILLEELHLDFKDRTEREEDRKKIKDQLAALHGIAQVVKASDPPKA